MANRAVASFQIDTILPAFHWMGHIRINLDRGHSDNKCELICKGNKMSQLLTYVELEMDFRYLRLLIKREVE